MKILILSASTGGGHMSAAHAIKSYVLNYDPDAKAEVVDALKYISPILDKTLSDGYLYLAKLAPQILASIYKHANKGSSFFSSIVALTNLFSKKLMPLLKDFAPDIIVCTQHFPLEMISNLKKLGLIDIPLVCVMTDYAPHRCWIDENVDEYIVANDGMVDIMVKMGVPKQKIHPFGIPVDGAFHAKQNKQLALEELGLSTRLPTILIMAGSFGVTDILAIYRNIAKIEDKFQIIIITGNNKRLYKAFEQTIFKKDRVQDFIQRYKLKPLSKISKKIRYIKRPVYHKPTKLIKFTKDVHKYMQVSDLIITKPGGLTVSEALACNLPMAIFNALPGAQEDENADFLVQNNMAIRLGKGHHCEQTIKKLLNNQEELNAMKISCESFDKSSSGEEICQLLEQTIQRFGNISK
jgi:processive 1,2-diacylglycerol beta-glucosyltransferase